MQIIGKGKLFKKFKLKLQKGKKKRILTIAAISVVLVFQM
jgi:hypothetical protein